MPYDATVLRRIFDRTDGQCHLCGKTLVFNRYAQSNGWEVEHSRPRSLGGTDHGNNLFAAHITCNRLKSNATTRTARAWNGRKRAPFSAKKKAEVKANNTAGGGLLGVILGGIFLGPAGALLGGAVGAAAGSEVDPEASNTAPRRKPRRRGSKRK